MRQETIDKILDITKNIPRGNVIAFESAPEFSDNTYWFFKYLVENTDVPEKYKLVWIVKDPKNFKNELLGVKIKCVTPKPKNFKQTLDFYLYFFFTKYIIDCNSYIYKKNYQQKRVFLDHGMPLKIVRDYAKKRGEVDLTSVTTYLFNDYYYSVGYTDDTLRNFGFCRTDIMFKHAGKRENRDKTSIIWAPTYRQHSTAAGFSIENTFPLGLPVVKSREEMEEINACLRENNAVLYIRPHPVQDVSVMHIANMSNITIADNDFLNSKNLQLYEFLTETDALITDYSSLYYDYLPLKRPVALCIEDLDSFKSKWEIYFDDFKENYKCPYLYTVDDLKKFILDVVKDNDEYEDERLKALDRFYDYTDGKACERIYKYMVENYGL